MNLNSIGLVLSNGEYLLETIEADRMPIGISSRMDQSFKMHKQKLEKGCLILLAFRWI